MTNPYADRQHAREAYDEASPENKALSKGKALPTSWSEAGLREDATLVFSDPYLDGGTIAYFFKDSAGRYFVFCQESAMRAQPTGQIPADKIRFFTGAPHPSKPEAVEVPLGSAADRFLIKVLANASSKQPPLPSPPQGKDWESLQRESLQDNRRLTKDQRGKLRASPGGLWVVQGITPDELKRQTTDDLITRLSIAPNPLQKGVPCVVVILLPLNQTDDIMSLEGFKAPANFYFLHLTKTKETNWNSPDWSFFFLPIQPIQTASAGFSFAINDPSFRRPEQPAGLRLENMFSSGTGRMFK